MEWDGVVGLKVYYGFEGLGLKVTVCLRQARVMNDLGNGIL